MDTDQRENALWWQRYTEGRKGPCEGGGRLELCCYKPWNAQGLQQLEEAGKDPLLATLEGAGARQHHDSRILASRTVETINSCCFQPPSLWLLQQPQGATGWIRPPEFESWLHILMLWLIIGKVLNSRCFGLLIYEIGLKRVPSSDSCLEDKICMILRMMLLYVKNTVISKL